MTAAYAVYGVRGVIGQSDGQGVARAKLAQHVETHAFVRARVLRAALQDRQRPASGAEDFDGRVQLQPAAHPGRKQGRLLRLCDSFEKGKIRHFARRDLVSRDADLFEQFDRLDRERGGEEFDSHLARSAPSGRAIDRARTPFARSTRSAARP